MARGGNRRVPNSQKALQGTLKDVAQLSSDESRERIAYLADRWAEVARLAVEEIASETSVTIVNAGDQVQPHPAVKVLESASKELRALVVLADSFSVPGAGVGVLPEGAPPAWTPKAVEGGGA
jgi:hypothetical protein